MYPRATISATQAMWLRELYPVSASPSPRPVGESGLDRRTGMQSSQHRDGSNGGASKLGRDVVGDAGKAENIDVQHLTGSPRGFEVLAAEVPQTEVKTFSGSGLFDYVRVPLELVADRRPNEIGTV